MTGRRQSGAPDGLLTQDFSAEAGALTQIDLALLSRLETQPLGKAHA